jgi:hypothetical protein
MENIRGARGLYTPGQFKDGHTNSFAANKLIADFLKSMTREIDPQPTNLRLLETPDMWIKHHEIFDENKGNN